MDRLNEWMLGFLPSKAFATEESMRVHALFVWSCFITAFFAASYCFMSIYITGYYFAIAMVVCLFIFSSIPFLLKRKVPLKVASNIHLTTIAIAYCFLIYWDGGIKTANVAPWIIVLPGLAMLIQGNRGAVTWLLIAVAIVIFFSAFYSRGINFPILFDADKDPVFNLLSHLGVLGMVYTVIYIFENGKNDALLKLEAKKAALEKLNREKSDLLSIVSHDLKNPLAIVRSLAEVSALPSTTDEKRAYYLENIARASDRMFELIKNLLDVNLMDSGKVVLYKEDLVLNEWITEYQMRALPLALARQIQLLANVPDYPVVVYTDKARLEQVLDNYVSNALKYNTANAVVIIRVTRTSKYTEIAVADNGPGITAAEMTMLFKPYGVTKARPVEGEQKNGLGLAIVKKIAGVLGAQAGCESVVGEGSSFYVRFEDFE